MQEILQTGSFTVAALSNSLGVSAGDSGTSSIIAVSPIGAFTGPVTLTVSSITDPNGNSVTNIGRWATFASSDGTSSTGISVPANETDTLDVLAPVSALAGDYTITITGTDSGGNTATTTIDLFVTAGFTLAANPASFAIAPGGSATAAITAITAGSQSGNVTLSGNVTDEFGERATGVTATFGGPAVIGGLPSTVNISVSPYAVVGTYLVNVIGTDAGGNTAITTIQATVQTGSFTLTPAITTVDVAVDNAPAVDTIAVAPVGAYSGSVTLSVVSIAMGGSNIPATGVQATFKSDNGATSTAIAVPGADTLMVTANSSSRYGNYLLTIAGTDASGNKASTEISVYVSPPYVVTLSPVSPAVLAGGGAWPDATTDLTALVTDLNGNPIPNVTVDFSSVYVDQTGAPIAGAGSAGSLSAGAVTTNSAGSATVALTSGALLANAKITGSVQEPTGRPGIGSCLVSFEPPVASLQFGTATVGALGAYEYPATAAVSYNGDLLPNRQITLLVGSIYYVDQNGNQVAASNDLASFDSPSGITDLNGNYSANLTFDYPADGDTYVAVCDVEDPTLTVPTY